MTSELKLIRELGEHLGPPAGPPPPELRERVLAAARPGSMSRLTAIRRSPLAAALASAAAVLIALAALVVPTVAGDTTRQVTVPSAGAPDASTAAGVLRLAGQTLAGAAEASMRPGQFRYTETVGVNQNLGEPGWHASGERTLIRQWWSADGGTGQVLERPVDGAAWRTVSVPGRAGAVPTDATAMHTYLYGPAGADFPGADADERAWRRAVAVLGSGRDPTPARVAALLAMARIPGLSLRTGAVDLAGRPGSAIVHSGRDGQPEVLFDADTYRYLGMNQTLPAIQVRTAVQAQRVVDNIGDVP